MNCLRRGRLLLVVLGALSLLAFTAGCGNRNPLVGKWTGKIGKTSENMQFNADGTWAAEFANGQATVGGTYKADKDTFTLTQTRLAFNGVSQTVNARAIAGQAVKYKVDGNTLSIVGRLRSSQLTRVQ